MKRSLYTAIYRIAHPSRPITQSPSFAIRIQEAGAAGLTDSVYIHTAPDKDKEWEKRKKKKREKIGNPLTDEKMLNAE